MSMIIGPDGKFIEEKKPSLYAPDGSVLTSFYQWRSVDRPEYVQAEFTAKNDHEARRIARSRWREQAGLVTQGERMVYHQIATGHLSKRRDG